MRILFILSFPLHGGGAGTVTRKLAEQLVKEGNKVAIAAPDEKSACGKQITFFKIKPAFRAVLQSHPQWPRAKLYSQLSPQQFNEQYCQFNKQIIEIVDKFKPDVLHINHAFFLTWIGSFIKSFYGLGYVVTIHGTDLYAIARDQRYRVLTKQGLERADALVPVSYHTRKWLLKLFGKKLLRKTKVIPNGVDIKAFNRRGKVQIIDKKYNLAGKKLVIFVGRLTPEKGVKYLIKAATKINAEIFILGSGEHSKYLSNYTKLIGADNVHMLGYFGPEYINELREFYQRADVVVVPSVWDEPLGLVVLEAMASSTPVVGTDKGGIPLVIKNGVNGYLVRARSSNAIATAVNKILKNPVLQEKMRNEARKIVEQKFDWPIAAKQYTELYKRAYETTRNLRDGKLPAQLRKDELERQKRELQSKLGPY